MIFPIDMQVSPFQLNECNPFNGFCEAKESILMHFTRSSRLLFLTEVPALQSRLLHIRFI